MHKDSYDRGKEAGYREGKIAVLLDLQDFLGESVACSDLRDFAPDALSALRAFCKIRLDAMGADR